MGFVTGIASFGVWLALLFVGVMVALPVWYAIRTRNGIPGANEDAKDGSHSAPTAESHG